MNPSKLNPDGRGKRRTVERWKTLRYPILIGLPILVALLWLLQGTRPEPLTSDEILQKEQWTESELTETLARAFTPQSNRNSREQVLNHLRRQLKQYPEEKQREIRIKALTGAVGESLRQIRAMPSVEQEKMFDAIARQAEKWQKEAQHGERRELLRQMRETEEGKALNTEIARIIHSEFTPEERRKFAPITMIWIQTLQ